MENLERYGELTQDRLDMLQSSFVAVLEQPDLFASIVDFFPYGIEVFDKNGYTVMINQTFVDDFNIPDRNVIVGKYNIFKDPDMEALGLTGIIKELFEGKTLHKDNIKVPLQSLRERYDIGDIGVEAIYQDAVGFPLFDEDSSVSHVVIMFITRRVYKGNASIVQAIEYIESNWDKAFNLEETAKAAGLSAYHFSRVFKADRGLTPYSYYTKYRLERLMELLRDANLSVREAFDVCKMKYSGHTFGVFKKHVGVTPAQYREMIKK